MRKRKKKKKVAQWNEERTTRKVTRRMSQSWAAHRLVRCTMPRAGQACL